MVKPADESEEKIGRSVKKRQRVVESDDQSEEVITRRSKKRQFTEIQSEEDDPSIKKSPAPKAVKRGGKELQTPPGKLISTKPAKPATPAAATLESDKNEVA